MDFGERETADYLLNMIEGFLIGMLIGCVLNVLTYIERTEKRIFTGEVTSNVSVDGIPTDMLQRLVEPMALVNAKEKRIEVFGRCLCLQQIVEFENKYGKFEWVGQVEKFEPTGHALFKAQLNLQSGKVKKAEALKKALSS